MLRLLMLPVHQQSEPTSRIQNNKNVGDDEKNWRLTSFFHHRNDFLIFFFQFSVRKKQSLKFSSPPVMCNLSNRANDEWIFKAKTDPIQAKLNPDLGGWIFKAKTDPSQAKLNPDLGGWLFEAKTDPIQAKLIPDLGGCIFEAKTDPSQAKLNPDLGV